MPSLKLLNEWGPCPPDGFFYRFPEDGYPVHAWTYVDWIQFAKNHLAANKRDVPQDLETLMQTQLCSTLPPGWCMYDDPARPRVSVSLGWNDVAQGIATFTRWIASGCKYVDQVEADRRALICSRCYLNVNVQGCSGCHEAVQQVVRNKESKFDLALHTCAVCKCFLRAKVHFPQHILDKENPGVQELYPEFCWLKKTGENYRG